MSAQVERPYRILTDNLTIQDTLKTKTPLSGSLSYYQSYLRLLERNADRLKALFREQSREYLKGLLEELDNNVEMAIEILKTEEQQSNLVEEQPAHIIQEQPALIERAQPAVQPQQPLLAISNDVDLLKKEKTKAEEAARSFEREASLLKTALIKVYKKFKHVDEKNQELEEELLRCRTELGVTKVMLSNKLSEEFSGKTNLDNYDVC